MTVHYLTASAHRRTPNELALMVIAVILACMNLGLGLSCLLTEPQRFNAPSFDVVKALAPITAWGWAFICTGLFAITTQITMRMIAVTAMHFIAGSICLFWAVCFALAVTHSPVASPTGPWAYAALGLAHWTVGAAAAVDAWFDAKTEQRIAALDE